MWDYEGKSVIDARNWNAKFEAQVPLSSVFLDVIQLIAKETGFFVSFLP